MNGICIDMKEAEVELLKDQDIHCLDEKSYLAYLFVAVYRMNPLKVKARIIKPDSKPLTRKAV